MENREELARTALVKFGRARSEVQSENPDYRARDSERPGARQTAIRRDIAVAVV